MESKPAAKDPLYSDNYKCDDWAWGVSLGEGKFIKSDPPTKLYSDNYDKIFTKKTPAEWAESMDVEIEAKDEDKVSYKQFLLDYDIEVE